jgi:hypothetical protein
LGASFVDDVVGVFTNFFTAEEKPLALDADASAFDARLSA